MRLEDGFCKFFDPLTNGCNVAPGPFRTPEQLSGDILRARRIKEPTRIGQPTFAVEGKSNGRRCVAAFRWSTYDDRLTNYGQSGCAYYEGPLQNEQLTTVDGLLLYTANQIDSLEEYPGLAANFLMCDPAIADFYTYERMKKIYFPMSDDVHLQKAALIVFLPRKIRRLVRTQGEKYGDKEVVGHLLGYLDFLAEEAREDLRISKAGGELGLLARSFRMSVLLHPKGGSGGYKSDLFKFIANNFPQHKEECI